jgi:hypothetical protein
MPACSPIVSAASQVPLLHPFIHAPLSTHPPLLFRRKNRYIGTIDASSKTGKAGQRFDSGDYEFQIGANEVVQAWDDGIVGMCVGEKRCVQPPMTLQQPPN